MAYLPGFRCDVFISYCHVDNEDGWVDAFHTALHDRLKGVVSRSVELWRDEQLDGSQIFDEVISNEIKDAAVVLFLCSRNSLDSDYCRQELRWFLENCREGSSVGERRRTLNVRLYNIPFEDWPAAVEGTSGFDFFSVDRSDLGERLDPESDAFERQILKLGDAIYRILESMHMEAEEPPPERRSDAQADVFVSEVIDKFRKTKQLLISQLEREGVAVFPTIPPPHDAKGHEEAVRQALDRCKVAVNMVGAWGDNPIDDDPTRTYGRKQVELALERSPRDEDETRTYRQLIWLPRALDFSDNETDEWQNFVDGLMRAQRSEDGYRVIRERETDLCAEVLRELAEIDAQQARESQPSVLLDTHKKDQLVANKVNLMFLEHNVQPYINPEEDDPRHSISILQERLKQVQALVIFLGEAGEEWVRARLAEAVKIVIDERIPLKTCGIFLAPSRGESPPPEFDLPLFNVHLLDNRMGLDPKTLRPILDVLGTG